jgi:hypothetical protein
MHNTNKRIYSRWHLRHIENWTVYHTAVSVLWGRLCSVISHHMTCWGSLPHPHYPVIFATLTFKVICSILQLTRCVFLHKRYFHTFLNTKAHCVSCLSAHTSTSLNALRLYLIITSLHFGSFVAYVKLNSKANINIIGTKSSVKTWELEHDTRPNFINMLKLILETFSMWRKF